MKKLFNADLVTLRSLFTNEYNANDRAKNYYIPLYQREYNWEKKHILKLFDDLNELGDKKTFHPYFLGGIVFSRQSMEGEPRTSMSLEVIDGQQRLTTLAILIATIVQSLKFEKRDFEGKEDFINNLIEELTSYTITKRFDENYNVSTVLKVERSDKLQELYEKVILNLINEKIVYKDYDYLEGENKKFFANVRALHRSVKGLKDNRLIHFTLQLLDHTEIVVTKTDSFETGYLVFEKLNDSGKGLSAHDLLKNYLFSIRASENDTNCIKEKWQSLLKIIDDIEPKVSPKDFLEYYLIITGSKYTSATTTDIFAGYKDYFDKHSVKNIEVLDQMIKIASKLKKLKNSEYTDHSLNQIGFKLGYLVFLSFYNKFEEDYIDHEERIFNLIFRLGFVYLISNDIKTIKKHITNICFKISETNYIKAEGAMTDIESDINKLILQKRTDFEIALSSENRYRRDHFALLIFELINTHAGQKPFSSSITIERIMPDSIKNINYGFEGIDEDNIDKYANLLGNLIPYNSHNTINSNDFEKRKQQMAEDETYINEMDNDYGKKLNIYNVSTQWGRDAINNRTEVLTDICIDLFIHDKIKTELLLKKTD